jgi:hypothetical protein
MTSALTRPVRVWTAGRLAALVVSVIVLAAGLLLFSNRAMAAFVAVAENGLPGHLSLQSDPYPAEFLDMAPGSVEHWQIQTELVDPSAPLTMQFKRDGELVERPGTDGLQLQARLCNQAWSNFPAAPTCGAGLVDVFGPTPANSPAFGDLAANGDPVPANAPVYDLGTLTNAQDKFLLVTLSIPQTPANQSDADLMGLEATIGFGFTADGTVTPVPPVTPPAGPTTPSLPNTGADIAALLGLAIGTIGIGLALRSARRAAIRGEA